MRLPELYTREEVAEKLKVNIRTIDRWRREGKLKGRKVGDGIRFTAEEVKKLIENDPLFKIKPKNVQD